MKKITKESLAEIVALSDVQVNPTGTKLAYVVNEFSQEENKYFNNIYYYDLKTNEAIQLTTSNGDKDIMWLDDTTILFQSLRGQTEQERRARGLPVTSYYTIATTGGEAVKAFTLPLNATGLTEITAGLYYFYAAVPTTMDFAQGYDPTYDERFLQEKEESFTIFDELPFWSNGKGVINKKRRCLFIYNQQTEKLQVVSPTYMNVDDTYINNQGELVYFGSNYDDVFKKVSEMYTYNLKTNENKRLPLAEDMYISSLFELENTVILYGNKTVETNSYVNGKFYVYQADGSISELNNLDISIPSAIGSDVTYGKHNLMQTINNSQYYTKVVRNATGLYALNAAGEEQEIIAPEQRALVDFAKTDTTVYYVGAKGQGLLEIFAHDITTGVEKQLTTHNVTFALNHTIAPIIYETFNSSAGDNLDCFVIKPADYDETKKYPAILTVRGGPKGTSGAVFFHEMQMFANDGYFVFYTNPRGSDGRGSAFANIEGERYGTWDYQDLMDLTDYVLAKHPQIDVNRLGIMGGSYGGFMTNWVVGHTNRFQAAATQRSIANYVTKCLTTDIGYFHNTHQMGDVTVWEDIDAYWDHSPLKYADKVKTPLLFIHSDEDYRCYMGDALQYFAALKLHGVETRFCLFHGENHELSRSGKPKNRLKRLEEMLNWMNKFLKKA